MRTYTSVEENEKWAKPFIFIKQPKIFCKIEKEKNEEKKHFLMTLFFYSEHNKNKFDVIFKITKLIW